MKCEKFNGIRGGRPIQNSQFKIHNSSLFALLGLAMLLLLFACSGQSERVTTPPTPIAEITDTSGPQTPTLMPGLPTSTPTPLVSPTPSPTMPPTATPAPAEQLETAVEELAAGDFTGAAESLEQGLNQPEALTAGQQTEGLFQLGQAYFEDGRYEDAVNAFGLLAAQGEEIPNETNFWLGRSREERQDWLGATAAYQAYLAENPEMAAYIQPRIGAAALALGQRDTAVAAYEAALSGPAHRLTLVEIHQTLARLYFEDGRFTDAVAEYDAVRELAVTENTKGQMTYLAGQALALAGDEAGSDARYLSAITQYPRAYESYLALVEWVESGKEIDDYQRGLIDYYAGAYEPGIAAFQRYLAANLVDYRSDVHLYLAWSFEGLGNLNAALSELDRLASQDAPTAVIERAKLLARAGEVETSIQSYRSYLEQFPDGPDAPFAAWSAAALSERLGNISQAAELYRSMADNYAWHEDAAEARFRAGFLANRSGEGETAVQDWLTAVAQFPGTDYAAAALVWLLKTPDLTDTIPLTVTHPLTLAQALDPTASYYPLRARDLAAGVLPFPPVPELSLPGIDDGRSDAEAWLKGWQGIDNETDIGALSPTLSQDPRLLVGSKLWRAGLWESAKRELEQVRQDFMASPTASYQLSLYFRDLGLYRSSILAANTVIRLSGHVVFDVPPFLARLAYPVYYADIILPLAREYSYDPVLQMALVRQESLFESFARSGAAAQGLAQVIPDTGAHIAQQLAWPNYQNEDLYKPYVGLAFGAYYLQQQLRLFDGMPAAALAAYNAGPGNAAHWFEQADGDHDLFVELVNFGETRLYIERIYTGYVIYALLYSASTSN